MCTGMICYSSSYQEIASESHILSTDDETFDTSTIAASCYTVRYITRRLYCNAANFKLKLASVACQYYVYISNILLLILYHVLALSTKCRNKDTITQAVGSEGTSHAL